MDGPFNDVLIGSIPRKVLCMLIKNKAFAPYSAISAYYRPQKEISSQSVQLDAEEDPFTNIDYILKQPDLSQQIRKMSAIVNWGTLESSYPNYPDIFSVKLTPIDRYYDIFHSLTDIC